MGKFFNGILWYAGDAFMGSIKDDELSFCCVSDH